MLVVSDKMREQVRQLLALAGDPAASPSEREIAMTRASILMARHSITSLDVEEAEREDIEVRELVVDGGPSTPSLATGMAIADVADAAGLFAYYTDYRRVRGRPHVLVHVAGFRSDLEWFMPLAMTLTAYAATGWVAWRRANAGGISGARRLTAGGFVMGLSRGLVRGWPSQFVMRGRRRSLRRMLPLRPLGRWSCDLGQRALMSGRKP